MLRANNISYSIDGKALLHNVSLSLAPGKMNLIIGPNGAGKSTLIKILSGQIKGFTGEVIYGEKNISSAKESELAKLRAVLSQHIEVAFPLTVQEVVIMGRYPHFAQIPSKKDTDACKESMKLFDIAELAERNYMTLSGGEKQRVHFARVMAQIWYGVQEGNRYLLLDEPLTFLDIHYQLDFMNKVSEMMKRENIVVVGVLHDLNLAVKYANHIVLLENGSILSQGIKEEVLTKENIKTAFQVEPDILKNGLPGSFYLAF